MQGQRSRERNWVPFFLRALGYCVRKVSILRKGEEDQGREQRLRDRNRAGEYDQSPAHITKYWM